MGFISRLFKRKKHGTRVGRIWRAVANKLSGGLSDALGVTNSTDPNADMPEEENND